MLCWVNAPPRPSPPSPPNHPPTPHTPPHAPPTTLPHPRRAWWWLISIQTWSDLILRHSTHPPAGAGPSPRASASTGAPSSAFPAFLFTLPALRALGPCQGRDCLFVGPLRARACFGHGTLLLSPVSSHCPACSCVMLLDLPPYGPVCPWLAVGGLVFTGVSSQP